MLINKQLSPKRTQGKTKYGIKFSFWDFDFSKSENSIIVKSTT